MKKNLFLYLFVFSVCINLFTYMYLTGQTKHEAKRVAGIEKQLKSSRDSLKAVQEDAGYFSMQGNDNVVDYFADSGFMDTPALEAKIKDGIIEMNTNPQGNPLTQNEPLNGQKFLINHIKVLNHRWIIADFSNGTAWGDVLIRYFVENDGKVTYETIQSTLYAGTVK